ncbi:MAG: hypothetical protein NC416_15375, partial [Eubacterium sp.]|nr:hypothetical protein [Eubacterium sp.]
MRKFIIQMIAFILCLTMGITFFTMPPSVAVAAEPEQYHFVFICPNKAYEYWTPIIEGMQKADEKQGTTTEIVGADSYDNWEENL